jgi:hypothetical protein
MASGGWCLDAKEPNCPADAHPARLSVMLMVGAVFFGDEALVPRASRDKVVFRVRTSVTGAYQSRLFRHTTSAAGCAVFVDSSL